MMHWPGNARIACKMALCTRTTSPPALGV
jgi:hypothetical protein